MIYDLPTSVYIDGTEHEINSDYRAILDIICAMVDPNLDNEEKALVLLNIFYPNLELIDNYEHAIKECLKFINMGEEQVEKPSPKLMDWEQDFQYIVAPVNRVMGCEIRSLNYLHWWTFIGAYYEIGDCTFAQIVRIRDQKAKGKKLDKFDQEWYNNHREIVDIKMTYSDAEQSLLAEWGIK